MNFQNIKQLFVDAHTLNKMRIQTLPHGPYLTIQLKKSATTPLLPVTISSFEQLISQGVEMTTKGEFTESLRFFRAGLQSVALLAVTS